MSYFNGKIFPIFLKLNFTPNSLGYYGLTLKKLYPDQMSSICRISVYSEKRQKKNSHLRGHAEPFRLLMAFVSQYRNCTKSTKDIPRSRLIGS